MKIQEQELFRGVVLAQIAESVDLLNVTRVTGSAGLYRINNDVNIVVKYRSSRRSPWRFTLTSNESEVLRGLIEQKRAVFLVLVCGNVSICALNSEEILSLVNLANSEQWINVEASPGSSLWVSGSLDVLKRSVRHSDFPKKIFEQNGGS